MDEEEDYVLDEEGGWKLLHGDVFRFPENKMLFTALLGKRQEEKFVGCFSNFFHFAFRCWNSTALCDCDAVGVGVVERFLAIKKRSYCNGFDLSLCSHCW